MLLDASFQRNHVHSRLQSSRSDFSLHFQSKLKGRGEKQLRALRLSVTSPSRSSKRQSSPCNWWNVEQKLKSEVQDEASAGPLISVTCQPYCNSAGRPASQNSLIFLLPPSYVQLIGQQKRPSNKRAGENTDLQCSMFKVWQQSADITTAYNDNAYKRKEHRFYQNIWSQFWSNSMQVQFCGIWVLPIWQLYL